MMLVRLVLLVLPAAARLVRTTVEESETVGVALDAEATVTVSSAATKQELANEKVDALLAELDALVGLESVKQSVRDMIATVRYNQMMLEQGEEGFQAQSLHMAFLGNPGTGKTVVARIVGSILTAMGVIKPPVEDEPEAGDDIDADTDFVGDAVKEARAAPKREVTEDGVIFVEASRADLVAQYKGQTAPKVKNVIKSALGGVLFIDEAYALQSDGQDTFSHEAIDTLIAEMEDRREHLVVIFAGYEEPMRKFFDMNKGFKSRVPDEFHLHFEDYTCEQLMQIGEIGLARKQMQIRPEARAPLVETVAMLTGCCDDRAKCERKFLDNPKNSNGRTVRNVLERSYRSLATRVVQSYPPEHFQALVEELGLEPPADLEPEARKTWEPPQQPEKDCGAGSAWSKLVRAAGPFTPSRPLAASRLAEHGDADLRCAFQDLTLADVREAQRQAVLEFVRAPCEQELFRAERRGLVLAPLGVAHAQWQESNWLARSASERMSGKEGASRGPAPSQACKALVEALFVDPRSSRYEAPEAAVSADARLQRDGGKKVNTLMAELRELIGIEPVKQGMAELRDMVEFDMLRRKFFGARATLLGQSFHMKFLGNPGTGKTVVARIVGELLVALGAIKGAKSGEILVEVSRSHLVGEYIGATALKVTDKVKSAFGRVLFIDEAYSLVKAGSSDSFGHEAVDTLIKEMEDNRDKVIVILAGYKKEMNEFFTSNPGFESRVPFTFDFADYTCPELLSIADLMLRKDGIARAAGSDAALAGGIKLGTGCCEDARDGECVRRPDNANARAVRNLLEASQRRLARRGLLQLQQLGLVAEIEALAQELLDAERAAKAVQLDGKQPPRVLLPCKEHRARNIVICEALETLGREDVESSVQEMAETQLRRACVKDLLLVTPAVEEQLFALVADATKAEPTGTSADSLRLLVQVAEPGARCRALVSGVATQLVDGGELGRRAAQRAADFALGTQLLETAEEDIVAVFDRLDGKIGLDDVKFTMKEMYALTRFDQLRSGLRMPSVMGQSLHMAFLGNPGTGKTDIARIVADLVTAMHAIELPNHKMAQMGDWEPPFVEVGRADLVGQHSGQTAPLVERTIKAALGGVVFIDEAYSLKQGAKDTYGQEAVDALIKEMEDKRRNVVVILAGYQEEMQDFLQANPGFQSRVPYTMFFTDYTCEQLAQIGGLFLNKADVKFEEAALDNFQSAVRFSTGCCMEGAVGCTTPVGSGNARAVRNLIEALFRRYARRIVQAMRDRGDAAPDLASARLLASDVKEVVGDLAWENLGGFCRPHGTFEQLASAVDNGDGRSFVPSLLGDSKKARLHTLTKLSHSTAAVRNEVSNLLIQSEELSDLHEKCTSRIEAIRRALKARLGQLCSESGEMAGLATALASAGVLGEEQSAFQVVGKLVKTLDEAKMLDELATSAQDTALFEAPELGRLADACQEVWEDVYASTAKIPAKSIVDYVEDTCAI